MLRSEGDAWTGGAESKGRVLRMTTRSGQEENLPDGLDEAALQSALERRPEVVIAVDFAERVAAQAAQLSPSRKARVPHYARITALVVACLVALSLFAMAPRTTASFGNMAFNLELVVLLHLAVLAWWLTRQTHRG